MEIKIQKIKKIRNQRSIRKKTTKSKWVRSSKDIAERILHTVESQMRRCPYTLGLGEMNIAGKPSLWYDAVCKPTEIHSLNKAPKDDLVDRCENQTVYTTHQIIESWIHITGQLLGRFTKGIRGKRFEEPTFDQLDREMTTFCFRLEELVEVTNLCKDLKHKVLDILEVEVDPKGGLRIQEAAMKLKNEKERFDQGI